MLCSILSLQITKSDIRPLLRVKWVVSLVFAGDNCNLPRGLCVYVSVDAFTLSPLKTFLSDNGIVLTCCY